MAIQFRGRKHIVKVAVNPHLRHPQILGTNWSDFIVLLGHLCAGVSWRNREHERGAVAQVGEAEPGPRNGARLRGLTSHGAMIFPWNSLMMNAQKFF